MWCHLLLAMPVMALGLFLFLPFPVALPAYLGLVLASLGIYYKVFQAMRRPAVTGREWLVGAVAEVVADIERQGQVRCRGEIWTAISPQRLARGQRVRIVGFDGVKAVVEPLGEFDERR